MSDLCKRCYIQKNPQLKKKDIKQLMCTSDKYKCDGCGEYKALVLTPRKREAWEDEDEFN